MRVVPNDWNDPNDPIAQRALGMKCSRCHQYTGNNNQGHYWASCSVTKTDRAFHFCCPGDCELEND